MTPEEEELQGTETQDEPSQEQEHEPETKSEPDTGSEKPPKFKFECQRTGDCCRRENIAVNFSDLQRWISDQTIFRVIHYLKISLDGEVLQLQLTKSDDGYCNLYHRDNKACSIHYNKPLFCKSYPLGFNGENYIIKSRECTGLDKGTMTHETLKEMRNDAFEDFVGRRQTSELLPILQSIFFTQLAEESRRLMDELSPEEKEKVEKMLNKKDEAEN